MLDEWLSFFGLRGKGVGEFLSSLDFCSIKLSITPTPVLLSSCGLVSHIFLGAYIVGHSKSGE
jgi:hypothetical protein